MAGTVLSSGAMANGDLLPSLVRHIAAARGKHKLEGLLRETRDRLGLGRAIRVTGSLAELGNSVQGAIVDGHIAVQTIRDLVDEVEETGGQHIFLYRLTPSGRGNLTDERLAGAFQAPPQGVTLDYYGDEPQRQTNFLVRVGKLIVKQVYTAEYWETNEDESERGATRRVTVQELRRRRAVNLLVVDPLADEAEIRIDRVHGNYHDLMLAELGRFEQTLASVSDVTEDLQPLAIRANFRALVQDRHNTYMAVDRAQDPSVAQTISSRRQGIQWHGRARSSQVRDGRRGLRPQLSVHLLAAQRGTAGLHVNLGHRLRGGRRSRGTHQGIRIREGNSSGAGTCPWPDSTVCGLSTRTPQRRSRQSNKRSAGC